MARRLSVVHCCVLCCLLLGSWKNARGQTADTRKNIPSPPQQTASWKAPTTKLSPRFVSATATLFGQGLADPRGYPYREITVVVGSFEPPWSDTVVKTHGWVLPNTGKRVGPFGVCWNGLVYPLVSIGKLADLRADALAASKGDVEAALMGTGRTWNAYFEDSCLCHGWEGRAVSQDAPLPMKACLLLRLGEASLAEKIWDRWASRLRGYSEQGVFLSVEESVKVNRPYLKDPYLVLANCWTLSLFDQSVAAHRRGNDRLALAAAEMLARAWPAAVNEATQRGFVRPSADKLRQGASYFLLDAGRANELLADQRRRAQRRRQGIDPSVLVKDYPDPEKFKHALLRRIFGPLMVVPAYRERVLELLEDRHEMSHVDVTSNAKISMALPGAAVMSTVPHDPLCPPPGSKVAFRVCDACAYALSPLEGTPRCELFWPERERDRAVAACAAMVRRYGHRFRLDERPTDVEGIPLWKSWRWTNSQVHLTFRPFDRPATAEDVRQGEAIFSLVGRVSVRVANMPKLPCRARWITLKDYPVLRDVWREPGQWEKTIGYEQEGMVWQAEEAEVRGRWQRYYGFLGRYGLAKVPGEEIEFLPSSERAEEWVALDDHFLIGWCAAPNADEERVVRRNEDSESFPPMLSYRRGQPMIFKVQAWNRSGVEQPLPALGEGPASTARNGSIPLSLELRYCRQEPMSDYEPTMSGWEPTYSLVGMSWTQVPRKTGERLTVSRTGRKAMPTELIDCLLLDLNRLFDVSRLGTYRLSLKARCGNRGGWQEDEVIFALGQKPAEPAFPGGS